MAREGVLSLQDIELRVVFEDEDGNLVDPDAPPTLYIYDASFSETDIEAEKTANTFTGLGPFTATQISTGYYEYVFTVPSGAAEGTWHDIWISSRDSVEDYEIFAFEVIESTVMTIQQLTNNQLIVIELDGDIADLDGITLGQDLVVTYSTRYSPLYASPELVRMEVGPWIDFIPDDTLNLMIHWASKEVDAITPVTVKQLNSWACGDTILWTETGAPPANMDRYRFARTKYVIYDAALRALLLPGAAEAANVTGAGQTKRLADLSITGPSNAGMGGSGLTMEQIKELKRLKDEWKRVVNARGSILPGQSLEPSWAVRGFANGDRRRSGRLWEDSDDWVYHQPTQNGKVRRLGNQRWSHFFKRR